MTEPTQEQIEAERATAHDIARGVYRCNDPHMNKQHSDHCTVIATALARRALESLVEAEAVAALHIAPVLIDNGCGCNFEGPHEGLLCEELGHEPCDMCRIERGLNAIRALRGKR